MTEEVWLPVLGFEGCYEVSNWGRVKRIKKGLGAVVGRIMTSSLGTDGYLYVTLTEFGKSKLKGLHAIVCTAFHGPPPSPRHEVNHKDGNPFHNEEGNLEWFTRAENNLHKCRVLKKCVGPSHPYYGMVGEKSKSSKEFILTSPEGVEYRIKGLAHFCKQKGLTNANFYKVMNGTISHHKGWKCRRP
jgi:NUMOD4 motif/HNH endonuclease